MAALPLVDPAADSDGEPQDGVLARFLPDHEVQERVGRHRLAEQATLPVLATAPNQEAALLLKSEPETALAAMQQEPLEGLRLIGLVMAYHALGQKNESDAALAELIDKHEESWPYNIAYTLAYRNKADRAFEWLDKAVHYNDTGLAEIPTEIAFANLHDDPR